MARDPERTKRRILAAARREFAAKGFAGARVDSIARRARVNKRMLYHYFGNKQRLFREIVRQIMTAEGSPFRAAREAPPKIAEHMLRWNEALRQEPDYIRLLQWEALETAGRRVIGEEERLEEEVESVERVRMLQREGELPFDLDPAQLLLTFIGMVAFPLAFPQLTRLVTGFGLARRGSPTGAAPVIIAPLSVTLRRGR